MKNIICSVVAHVDSGKTTLIESMLFLSGALRKQGRVDHQDTFLDYNDQERKRGITIYSKEAQLNWNDTSITIIDTPGHVDFSAEMERALSVLDTAILVISSLDGIQSHTRTIWKCLKHYQVPTFIFVNKMDSARFSQEEILQQLHQEFSDQCVNMEDPQALETCALSNEEALTAFLETGSIPSQLLQEAIEKRELFPVYFGSALKNEGVSSLLDALTNLVLDKQWPKEFGAKVFKSTTAPDKTKLVHLKITGGSLKARQKISDSMKADQIRLYSGKGFELTSEVFAGQICAVKGFDELKPGDVLGFEKPQDSIILLPSLSYELVLPEGCDPTIMMGHLKAMMLEDPTLEAQYDSTSKRIFVHLMGEIQMEVLSQKIFDETGFKTTFGDPGVIYAETIEESVYGYGHFEPLHHYGEVHVRLDPLPRGSGLQIVDALPTGALTKPWQTQLLSLLHHTQIKGVLTNSKLTDVKITLINARGHSRHTKNSDLLTSALRAIRQGLKKGKSRLLEPTLQFSLTLSPNLLSKALYDFERKHCTVQVEELPNKDVKITGIGPVRELINYQTEVRAYSKGLGHFETQNDGYMECIDPEKVIESIGYDSEMDQQYPTGSVVLVHHSPTYIHWDSVEEWMQIPIHEENEYTPNLENKPYSISEESMRYFFEQAGGRNVNQKKLAQKRVGEEKKKKEKAKKDLSMDQISIEQTKLKQNLLVVDGYNMIFGWEHLKELSKTDLFAAREQLINELIHYTGYKNTALLIVFDGYKPIRNHGSSFQKGNAQVVYTRHGQSADAYIEKAVHDRAKEFNILVASSDSLIQNSILASGATRISARELERRIEGSHASIQEYIHKNNH